MRNVIYHFTTKRNLKKILKDNRLRISERCGLRAVSFTRDRHLLRRCLWLNTNKCDTIIVLDRDKLRNDYRIEPFDFFSRYPMNPTIYKEAEELVRKDIKNLDRYMLEVIHL